MASDLDSLSAQPAQLPPGFDGLQYIASHGDLVLVLGEDEAAGEQHYLAFGEAEGRETDTFDEEQYLANYEDLRAAFGTDTDAATAHYIRFGFGEDRTDEVLPPGFDGLQYIASHEDLIAALGADALAGEQHYLAFGEAEGRETDTFDEEQYLANYEDLRAAFGTDTDAATTHYIRFGFGEDRTDDPQPANEPPEFTSAARPTVEENTTEPVVALAADDPDGDEVAFAITGGADQDLFEITGGDQLAFVDPPDFEEPGDADGNNTYLVQVTADDGQGGATPQNLTVTVADDPDEPPANGPPVFTSAARPRVEENTTEPVVALAADDPDGDEVAFAITGGADQDLFEITGGDQLAFVDPPDFEEPGDADGNNTYLVQVTADDGQGGATPQNLTVTVADDPDEPPANGPPVFTSVARPRVEENTTEPVVTLAADDPDGDEVAFAITGGADQDLFEITGGDQLAFVDPPDFEEPGDADGNNTYLVQVTADDGQGGATPQNLTVTVADDPDEPAAAVAALDFVF